MSKVFDVVIVGGALTGSCTAYHLLTRDPSLRIGIIEKDPSFEFAASSRSNAMVRTVFSQPENLLMSRYGQSIYGDFSTLMDIDGSRPPLDYERGGLMIIGNTEDQALDILTNREFQIGMGCDVELLTPQDINDRWPDINTDDVVNAVLSPDAGWIDPHGAMTGLRKKVRTLGAEYIIGEVVDLKGQGVQMESVILQDGQKIFAKWVVNAAGAWAGALCTRAGFDIPVVPLPRMVYYFETQNSLQPLPYVRDGLGVGFRREGRGYISGITDFQIAGEFDFDVRHDWFEERVWEGLANRVPKFESIKVMNSWVGHYAQNLFDGNMVIGAWPGRYENFLIATGFSGHGLQHAPAIGRALSELILDGEFKTIDLSRLGCQRLIDNTPYAERGWKA